MKFLTLALALMAMVHALPIDTELVHQQLKDSQDNQDKAGVTATSPTGTATTATEESKVESAATVAAEALKGAPKVPTETLKSTDGIYDAATLRATNEANVATRATNNKLTAEYEAKYKKATASARLAEAAKEASTAAANMATSVRQQQADAVAGAMEREQTLKAKIATGKFTGVELGDLNIELAKAQDNAKRVLAKSKIVLRKVDRMIQNAGAAEGDAVGKATFDSENAGDVRLTNALIAADEAHAHLEEFDARVKQEHMEREQDAAHEKRFHHD